MYFRLNPECYFVKGAKCGAIYDLLEGNLYSLTSSETQLIESCEKNQTVVGDEPFLKQLKKLCVGNFYDNKVYIEKIRYGSPLAEAQVGVPPRLNRVFLEIGNRCNYNCWYCGAHGVYRTLGCLGCNIWHESGNVVPEGRWRELIDEIVDLGCSSIVFTGGDLTLDWEKTMSIIDHAAGRVNDNIIVINARSYTDNIQADLNGKAKVIVQSEDPGVVHDDVLNLLLLPPDARVRRNDAQNYRGNVTVGYISADFRAAKADLPIASKDKIPKLRLHSFLRNVQYHPCLGNSLTVAWNGEVIPCPMIRDDSYENISDCGLSTIIQKNQEKIEHYWANNLDMIDRCSQCEFRYACDDCRALERALTQNVNGKLLCNYDPLEAKWE